MFTLKRTIFYLVGQKLDPFFILILKFKNLQGILAKSRICFLLIEKVY